MLCLDGSICPRMFVHLLLHTVYRVVLVGTHSLHHYYMFAGKVGREEHLRAMIPPKHKGKPRYWCICMSVHGVGHMSAHPCVAMFLSTPLHTYPWPCFYAHVCTPSHVSMHAYRNVRTPVYARLLKVYSRPYTCKHAYLAHSTRHILNISITSYLRVLADMYGHV
jgi:hypothetical protein